MAANDYYNPSSRPGQAHTPQLPYQSYNTSSPTPAPSLPAYATQPPSRTGTQSTRRHDNDPVSPFEAPFDDHSKHHRGDSRYYGQGGGGRQDSQPSFRDDIPLQDHPGVPRKDTSTDHVYDAAEAPPHLGVNTAYNNQYDAEGRSNNRRSRGSGFGKKKKQIAWVTYAFTIAQVAVFIAEIVKNGILTGSPIEIHPQFNPMIGPSPYVLINMGARFVPCMHNVQAVQGSAGITWPCPNSTTATGNCTLGDLCGFNFPQKWEPLFNMTTGGGMSQSPQPDQWWRFIIPMFLHAGIVHIGFNMLLQMTIGKEMELIIGPIRYFLVYVASGIFGFVLGGNFAAEGIASTGASGALFGVIALNLLDLIYKWDERVSPWKDFMFIMLDIVISFVLGLLPGLDNFSHIGGFFMGLVLGICILRSPNSLQKRIGQDPPYTPVNQHKGEEDNENNAGLAKFAKAPVGFFKGRKPAWWAWWLVRVAALVFVLIVFILLLNNFYTYRKKCGWCKYLSCINYKGWCSIGQL
ncbi:rhomboid family membrane protein-like protein [Halenospora varia]|nr:rhomboid family membrane protein-like protein [Halenospora varia]